MTVFLAPLWEIWNWSDSDFTFFGVAFLLFGAYGAGYAHAHGGDSLPRWVYVALIALMIGFFMVVVPGSVPCEPGECERPGP